MKLQLLPEETELRGGWVEAGNSIIADETAERIRALTSRYLEKIAADDSGWQTLYRDPRDGRYWELTYPLSEMHGGGPPALTAIPAMAAAAKYGLQARRGSAG